MKEGGGKFQNVYNMTCGRHGMSNVGAKSKMKRCLWERRRGELMNSAKDIRRRASRRRRTERLLHKRYLYAFGMRQWGNAMTHNHQPIKWDTSTKNTQCDRRTRNSWKYHVNQLHPTKSLALKYFGKHGSVKNMFSYRISISQFTHCFQYLRESYLLCEIFYKYYPKFYAFLKLKVWFVALQYQMKVWRRLIGNSHSKMTLYK